jgi:chromosomal replication initiator protein
MTNTLAVWSNAQQDIRQKIGESGYQSWITHLGALCEVDNTLILAAPDEFFMNWIMDHYFALIQDILKKHSTTDITIEMRIIPQEELPRTAIPAAAAITTTPANNGIARKLRGLHLNPRLTFDNFVVGSSNQMACGASQAVANSPAKAYNPLFLYGQSGLGKTHLMQAVANYVVQNNPNLQCAYLTSEQFTNELIDSIHHKTMNEFKQKYRNVDILLIDDIQFIAGKRSTQEEFFHTFNAMHDNHKQIIITSDRPPKEISDLEDRLVTRFLWGLIVDIQPPDFETRVAILRKKTELESVKVPDDVVFFIAEQIKTNIRELEGALIRVVACSMLQEKPINLQLAQLVLKNMLQETSKIISIEMIQQVVCDHFKINVNDLKNNKRTKNFVLPRQIAMYLIRTLTRHSLPEIGKAFGGKDHTTVLYAFKKIEENLTQDSEIKYIVEKLSTILKQ